MAGTHASGMKRMKWLASGALGAASLFAAPSAAWAADCNNPTPACKDAVTAYDAYCTNVAWDSICVNECGTDGFCQSEGQAGVSCTSPDAACKGAVSVYDPYCTNVAWDSLCQNECGTDS